METSLTDAVFSSTIKLKYNNTWKTGMQYSVIELDYPPQKGKFTMKRDSFLSKIALLAFVLPNLLFPLFFTAAAASAKTVRVAFPIQKGLSELDENGNYSGYTYEYLQEISQYTGWKFEFVLSDGDDTQQLVSLMDMLDNGEIDLMGGMLYYEANKEKYDYSTQSYGSVETVLQTTLERIGDIIIDANKPQTFKIAVLKTSGDRIKELENYCEMNRITPEYVLCENEIEQRNAIEEGRADMLLNTSMNPIGGVRTIASFAPKPFYFVVSKKADGQIINELNMALKYMAQSAPSFSAELYQKYFAGTQFHFQLSEAERDYVSKSGTLRLGVVENQPPYYYPASDGSGYKGITVDLASLLSERTGLKFEFVEAKDNQSVYKMLQDEQIDLIATLFYSYENAQEHNLSMTDPYLTSTYILVMADGMNKFDLQGKRLAATAEVNFQGDGKGTVSYFDNMSDCMRAVIHGKADYTYVDAFTAQYFSNLPEFWNLQQTSVASQEREFCFGMKRPVDVRLMAILNKAVLSISQEEQQVITTNNTVPDKKLSFSYIWREYSFFIVSALVVLALALLAWGRQHAKAKRLLQEEMDKRNQLYSLMEDYFFEYYHDKDVLIVPNSMVEGPEAPMTAYQCAQWEPDKETGREFIRLVRSKQDGTFEIQDKCIDEETHWLRVMQKNLYDASGKLSCVLGKVKLIDEEKRERSELLYQAQHDGLTGLFNAQTFHELFEEENVKHKEGQCGALVLLDIDYFKRINDVFGHLQGDRALCWLASMLTEHLEAYGIVGRYGGDEFIAYISDVKNKDWLKSLLYDFCKKIREGSERDGSRLTVSMGAVLVYQSDDYETLFRTADRALYETKAAGRDGFYLLEKTDSSLPCSKSVTRCEVIEKWLDDTAYQAILRETHMIPFEYDIVHKLQRVSPFIGDYICGNYDGRLLSDVMVEDGVIYPDDLKKSLAFREKVVGGQLGEMVLRLLTPNGDYKWFRMVMTYHAANENQKLLVGVLEDINAQMQYQELLRHRAEIDPISGVFNKETFFEKTQKLLKEENETGHYLFRFDVDRFKLINELFGSAEGNKVLQYIGSILQKEAAGDETFGRLGNDVFCMCVTRSREDTIALVEKIANVLRSYPLAFRFFLPTGIIFIPSGCKDPVDVLCDRAALAQNKIKGKYLYRYAFYEPAMGLELNREHELIANMEKALEEQQFLAYFQPQYDMRDGRIIGAEALARWQHPTLGMISPAEFIPLFERNGFIIELDEYIWTQVCRTIRKWLDMGLEIVPISVNVSRVHLYDTDFCKKIIALCDTYRVPRKYFELEITESAYTERPQELFPIMDLLHQSGFVFAMDDFGSGYSSLNILKDIPVNIVKFDLRFLEEARNGVQAGRSILKNIVQLTKDLHLSVLAEGVETETQMEFLKEIGCHFAQGFYYARPMPLKDFETLLYSKD